MVDQQHRAEQLEKSELDMSFREAVEIMTERLRELRHAVLSSIPAMESAAAALLELEIAATGKLPHGLGRIIRLKLTSRWIVAGRWLVSDEFVQQPRGLWGRMLAGMIRDVMAGRTLAEPGF